MAERSFKRWTDDEMITMLDMLMDKHDLDAVSHALGRSNKGVLAKLLDFYNKGIVDFVYVNH